MCIIYQGWNFQKTKSDSLKFKSKKKHQIHNLSVNYSFNVSHTVVYGK